MNFEQFKLFRMQFGQMNQGGITQLAMGGRASNMPMQSIEEGTAEEIFHNPIHAYTRGLLASVPRLDAEEHVRLQTIEGLPPDLIAPPPGCAFSPRRAMMGDYDCSKATTDLVEVSPEHWVANCPGCIEK